MCYDEVKRRDINNRSIYNININGWRSIGYEVAGQLILEASSMAAQKLPEIGIFLKPAASL